MEPQLTENALKVLKKRYLEKNEAGEVIETPTQMFERVARHVASAEEKDTDRRLFEEQAFEMMVRRDFLPNTPCLANAGRKNGTGQLSACFVLPIEDSMIGIMETLKHAALIHQSGGGTGFSFSQLRPANDFVRSTTGVASGPISFMEMYNHATECVKQSGLRRGANMGILRCDHPDILAFIDCKQDVTKITNFNISVGITNAFMGALVVNGTYRLINPRNGHVVGELKARDVWNKIVANAWRTGEPGLFFIDRVNELDPLSDSLGPIEATNPCGEVPLRAYDACTLGSVNLGNFVEDRRVDFQRLRGTVYRATRFLDNVLTVNKYPIQQIHEVTSKSRKIGLGVMGWADMLIRLGVRYDSDQALVLAGEVMGCVNATAGLASVDLAEIKGPFPAWEGSEWAKLSDIPRRNSTVTVIAPTGSISIIAGCSSGIEPLLALSMIRNQADMKMRDDHPLFVEAVKRVLNGTAESALERAAELGSCQSIEELPLDMRELYRTAGDISAEWHVRMQAAFQAHTEDAVSKTINLPNAATVEDVERAYQLAWASGCKGITVYRDGSRPMQVLTTAKRETQAAVPQWGWRRIPEDGVRDGRTFTKPTGFGNVHVTINAHPSDGEPFECFASLGKGGSEVTAFAAALGRASSLLLAIPSDLPPRDRLMLLARQFAGLSGTPSGFGDSKVESVPDAISKAILQYLGNGVRSEEWKDVCPDCHKPTLFKGGKCDLCASCGYSKC